MNNNLHQSEIDELVRKLIDMKIGTNIEINDGSEWDKLTGTILEYIDNIPVVMCPCRPGERYYIYPHLVDKIKPT
jgi:hypothetical protein